MLCRLSILRGVLLRMLTTDCKGMQTSASANGAQIGLLNHSRTRILIGRVTRKDAVSICDLSRPIRALAYLEVTGNLAKVHTMFRRFIGIIVCQRSRCGNSYMFGGAANCSLNTTILPVKH